MRRMRPLGALREIPRFYLVQLLQTYRKALLDSGRELAARGQLASAEDIFFLPLTVLNQLAQGERVDVKSVVAAERQEYERERTRKRMPRLLLSTGETFYDGMSDVGSGATELIGEPVSPGVDEGRVRVLLDPGSAPLEPGDILVCRATDPGWTPLFLTAGGVVTELGSPLTHSSMVAREYGLPAIVRVPNATTCLKTGQWVRMDGSSGRVPLVRSPP
jgi:pyruvate,water dikinase